MSLESVVMENLKLFIPILRPREDLVILPWWGKLFGNPDHYFKKFREKIAPFNISFIHIAKLKSCEICPFHFREIKFRKNEKH